MKALSVSLLLSLGMMTASTIAAPNLGTVTVSDFVKLGFKERVEICAAIVASNQIGDCASISSPLGDPADSSTIAEIAKPCFDGGVSDSQTLGKCVRERLDQKGIPAGFPSAEHITRAYDICSTTVSSNEIGICTASLCTRLEN